jgi:simple sugar transport system ATP-binding protein
VIDTDTGPAIAVRAVTRSFGHVQALRGVDLDVYSGQVLALMGDNGAGKSTLTKILAGALAPDGGQMRFWGQDVRVQSISHAQELGIETVYQDLALAPDLSVVDNMFLGREELATGWRKSVGVLNRQSMHRRARAALDKLGVQLRSLRIPVRDLSGGQRQAVAIARAVMWATTAILMDEPTAALGARQTARTNEIIRAVADRGLAVVVVSHDIPNMIKVADRVAVLRRGEVVSDQPTLGLTVDRCVGLMLGSLEGSR